jgi:hypothetical protein
MSWNRVLKPQVQAFKTLPYVRGYGIAQTEQIYTKFTQSFASSLIENGFNSMSPHAQKHVYVRPKRRTYTFLEKRIRFFGNVYVRLFQQLPKKDVVVRFAGRYVLRGGTFSNVVQMCIRGHCPPKKGSFPY